MIFENYVPRDPITPFIESVFHFKDFVPDHSVERVVPTGHVFLLFELDGFERHTFDNSTLELNKTVSEVWISGMHRNYISISAHENSEMLVIQFKPFGAYPFFHFPIEGLNERIVPARDLLGEAPIQLRSHLMGISDSAARFRLVEDWLLERYDETKSPPSDFVTLVERLREAPIDRLSQLIEDYPASQKHLIGQFRKYVGLTPKYFQRIQRFNEILQKIQSQKAISWTDIAYECGYSDQSHFIKEFRHFSGFNPSEFLKHEFDKEEPNFFPLDRDG
jgi:AraC-like DNA-binding protein